MRKSILSLSFLMSVFASTSSAFATTYDIDLTNLFSFIGSSGPCYCYTNLYYSPVFSAQPGDVFKFGRVQLYAFQTGPTPDAGPYQILPLPWLISTIGVSYSPTTIPVGPGGLPNLDFDVYVPPFWSAVYGLDFTVPAGGTDIQIDFAGPEYSYIPGVPESSTWAMLLIGFAAIGFAGYRRRQKLYPLVPC
jgi:hypothetical protein